MHLVNSRTGNREKPLYIFVYALLAACRHGTLIISAEGLEDSEEEEMEGEEMEGEEEGLLGASREFVPTFEEHISGTSSAGPVELVVLKGEDEDRDDALFGGLSSGLGAGCEAVLVVEVVKAQLVFNNIWQGMAQGIELARQNKSGEPVRVIVTDASTWYFFGLQAVKKGSAADPQAVQGATGAGGLEFSFRKSEETSEETFRLFDCAMVNADALGRNVPSSVDPASALRAVEVMYRLYTALYPDQDISRLPDLIRQGNAEAKRVADAWAERMVEGLERLDAEAVSAAAALETERRLRVEAEAGRAEAEAGRAEAEAGRAEAEAGRAEAEAGLVEERRRRVEAEEQLQALLQQVEAMRGSSRAAASEGGGT